MKIKNIEFLIAYNESMGRRAWIDAIYFQQNELCLNNKIRIWLYNNQV